MFDFSEYEVVIPQKVSEKMISFSYPIYTDDLEAAITEKIDNDDRFNEWLANNEEDVAGEGECQGIMILGDLSCEIKFKLNFDEKVFKVIRITDI